MEGKYKAIELTLASMFVVLMAIGANITTLIPGLVIGGVPITLQTFFAILTGLVLGSRLGALSISVYAFMGLVGIPVFAQFTGGLAALIKPTFGFILSYILVAYIVGKITAKSNKVSTFVVAALVGTVINYFLGTNWMYFAYLFWADAPEGFTYGMAWLWMLAPLPKDIILAVVAAYVAYRLRVTVFAKGRLKNIHLGA
nr:biotin transporter BioY [uncultured Bacillus sp.]